MSFNPDFNAAKFDPVNQGDDDVSSSCLDVMFLSPIILNAV